MKIENYNLFWQRIHKSAKEKHLPLRVMFELTYRCNFSCRHCYVPLSYRKKSKTEELKTKEVFCILDQLKDIGCFYLGFTGGEPFKREDIMDILWYAKRSGFEIIIYTNGSLIDKEKVDELAQLAPNKVDITIPAMNEDAFESITGVSGSRDKVFATVELLYKKGVNLGFKTCVLKQNESQIQDIQNFAISLGALYRLDGMLSARLDGSKEPYRYRGRLKDNFVSRPTSYVLRQKIINCNSETIDYELSTMDLFKCGVGRTQAAITPFGELKMCVMVDYPCYKILEASLNDCWQRLKQLVGDIKPDDNYKCNTCQLLPLCKWCPARGWLENRNFTTCDPECRRRAEFKKIENTRQSHLYAGRNAR